MQRPKIVLPIEQSQYRPRISSIENWIVALYVLRAIWADQIGIRMMFVKNQQDSPRQLYPTS
jgi:hypothetical protein